MYITLILLGIGVFYMAQGVILILQALGIGLLSGVAAFTPRDLLKEAREGRRFDEDGIPYL